MRPLYRTGGKFMRNGSKYACCCGPQCSAIITSLCSDDLIQGCGFTEFDDGTDPSCPRKYYKTLTQSWHNYGTLTSYDNPPNEPGDQFSQSYSFLHTNVLQKAKNEAGECVTTVISSEGSVSDNQTFWESDPYNCSDSWVYPNAWEGDTSMPCAGWSWGDPFFYGGGGVWGTWTSYSEVKTKTSLIQTYTFERSDPIGGGTGNKSGTATFVYSAILSEEVTLADVLRENLCPEDPCSPGEPDCRPCCTDGTTGRKWDTEGDCYIPSNSPIAWESTACTETTGRKKGQSSVISIAMKGLTPGTQYRLLLHYSRCELAKDDEGEYIPPSCGGGSCEEGDPEVFTEEMIFEATDWAEILGYDCGACEIAYRKCEFEDEAESWNAANPEATPRTVSCTTGGFNVPTANNYLTKFEFCELEKVETEP